MHSLFPNRRAVLASLTGSALAVGPFRSFAQDGVDGLRFQYSVQRQSFGVVISAMRDGNTLITVRSLGGRFRTAMVLPRSEFVAARSFDMTYGGRTYALHEAGEWIGFNGADVDISPPDGGGAQTTGFFSRLRDRIGGILQGIAVGIAVGVTLIMGGETFIPYGPGKSIHAVNFGGEIRVSIEHGGSGVMLPPPGTHIPPGAYY